MRERTRTQSARSGPIDRRQQLFHTKRRQVMSHSSTMSRSKTIAVWVLRILLAALFLFASFMKLTSRPPMVHAFDIVGIGQWFRYFTGALELVGGVAILIPSISVLGALLLLVVDIGAFVAQIAVLHEGWIHPIVIGAAIGIVIYLQRTQLNRDR
jgi:uncharacterized membrane protein YphA (DoxX/SURF4 family)